MRISEELFRGRLSEVQDLSEVAQDFSKVAQPFRRLKPCASFGGWRSAVMKTASF